MLGAVFVLAKIFSEQARTVHSYIVTAVVGGCIVFGGLVLETVSEKEWYKNVSSFRFWKLWKSIGESCVMCGVLIETGVGALSYQDAPLLQNITSISATAEIYTVGTNFDLTKGMYFQTTQPTNPIYLINQQALFTAFGGREQLAESTTNLPVLYCLSGDYIPLGRGTSEWKLSFPSLPSDFSLADFSNNIVGDVSSFNAYELWIAALTTNDQVIGGSMTFTANGKKAPPVLIPSQTPRNAAINYTNFVDGMRQSMTVFFGTNHLNKN